MNRFRSRGPAGDQGNAANNPLGQSETRFSSFKDGRYASDVEFQGFSPGHPKMHKWRRRRSYTVPRPGQSPALQMVDPRADTQAPGTIRRNWRQTVTFIRAAKPFPVSDAPSTITRVLRYKASSTYDSAHPPRFSGLHTYVRMRARNPQPTLMSGRRQGRPVLRNRMSSFGSRVRPENVKAPASEV